MYVCVFVCVCLSVCVFVCVKDYKQNFNVVQSMMCIETYIFVYKNFPQKTGLKIK